MPNFAATTAREVSFTTSRASWRKYALQDCASAVVKPMEPWPFWSQQWSTAPWQVNVGNGPLDARAVKGFTKEPTGMGFSASGQSCFKTWRVRTSTTM